MDILEVVVRFYPYVGGVENTVYQLGTRFVQRGHRVQVICAAEPDGPPVVDGIEVTRLPFRGKIGNTNLALGLRSAVLRAKPALIHTHMPTAWFADAAAMASVSLQVPLVLSYNNDLMGSGVKGLLAAIYNRTLLPRLLSKTARIVVPNPRYQDYSPYLGAYADKIVHIPWGVDLHIFRPTPLPEGENLQLSFLSLLDTHHGYKGLDELFRALVALQAKGHRVRLNVGGSGERLHWWRQRASELGLTQAVSFMGFVPDDEIAAFFARSDVFVLPSKDARQEGFGLVLLEAMAAARPVVTTHIVGMAHDIERHDTGVLVPPGDVEALTHALEECIENREALRRKATSARRLVERLYSWERVTEGYLSLFRELVEERRA